MMNADHLLIINMAVYYVGSFACIGSGALFVAWALIWACRWAYWAACELTLKWHGLVLVTKAIRQVHKERNNIDLNG